MASSKELAGWIEGQLHVHKVSSRVALYQQTVSRNGIVMMAVATWKIGDVGTAELADLILQEAQDDASVTTGTCRYAVVIEDDDGQALARKAVRIDGSKKKNGEDIMLAPEEPPNEVGMAALAMRHQEIGQRLIIVERETSARAAAAERETSARVTAEANRFVQETVGMVRDTFREALTTVRAENAELRIECAALRAERAASWQQREDLASEHHVRTLEIRKQTNREELRGRTLTRLEPAIPVILNKLLGVSLVPEDKHNAVDSLMLSFTEKQVDTLAAVLTNEQKLALHALFKEAEERKKTKDQAADVGTPAPPKSTPNGAPS